jgi:hypothetical protein
MCTHSNYVYLEYIGDTTTLLEPKESNSREYRIAAIDSVFVMMILYPISISHKQPVLY